MHQISIVKLGGPELIYHDLFTSLFSDFSVISFGYFNYLKINLLKQMLAYI